MAGKMLGMRSAYYPVPPPPPEFARHCFLAVFIRFTRDEQSVRGSLAPDAGLFLLGDVERGGARGS